MSKLTPDQMCAIETLDKNLLVKAGAGAGKTRVLVERYLHILKSGAADMDGIVAITFTRKAAREMKERIRDRVNELMSGASDEKDWRRWREVSVRLDAVNISTIHSLCSRILREHPAEAGIDPDFGVMEELDEKTLLDEVWNNVLEDALREDADWLKRILVFYSPAQVREGFRSLFEAVLAEGLIGPKLEEYLWPVAAGSHGPLLIQLKQAYLALFRLIPANGKRSATQERLQELGSRWTEIESRIDHAIDDPSELDKLEEDFKGMRGSDDLRLALQHRRASAEALRGTLLDQAAERLLPDLCQWFRVLGCEWARTKRLRRTLTYDDLEKETEKLLGGHKELCDHYSRRIQFLMVDECQDINESQRRIIYLLAGGDSEVLRRQSLFAVGDGKQSIYRFRGADSRVFVRLQEDVCLNAGKVIELARNFRSHRHLVAVFNEFFAGLMPAPVCEEEAEGADTVEYSKIEGFEGGDTPARIDLWVVDAEKIAGTDVRRREAEMIASRIRGLVADSSHPVRYGQIALLLRAFTNVSIYEEEFAKAGIPYYVAGGRGFSGRQEIADVLNLLRFLCNPLNETALFATLRSPFFLLSDEALLKIKRNGGEGGLWAGLTAAESVEGLTAEEIATSARARTMLGKWISRRSFLTPEKLIREVLADTGFGLLQLTQFMGIRRYANLMKIQDLASEFMASKYGDLAEFLDFMDKRSDSEPEAEIDSETGDTVRIMTIHKSKGLEFPVVILPDLHRKFNSRNQMTVFLREMGMGIKVPDSRGRLIETGRFRRIARRDNAMERAELKRVLYVAMTRAEKQVILSAVASRSKTEKNLRNASGWLDWARQIFGLEGSPAEWPKEKCAGDTCLYISVDEEEGKITAGNSMTKRFPPRTTTGPLSEVLMRNLRSIPVRERRPLVLSPAYLADYVSCPRRYYYSHIFRLPVTHSTWMTATETAIEGNDREGESSSGLTAIQLGVAFHKFLELLPGPEHWQKSMKLALLETLPPQQWDMAEAVLGEWASCYAGSALYSELGSVLDERREWSFQYRLLPKQGPLPSVWLSGQVDRLVFYSDGTMGIVDYKTDRLDENPTQKKTARYRLQLSGYALAARAVFGRMLRDARLYFVRAGETAPVDVRPESLVRAELELQDIAGFIRSHPEEKDYPCNLSHCLYCPYQEVCGRI